MYVYNIRNINSDVKYIYTLYNIQYMCRIFSKVVLCLCAKMIFVIIYQNLERLNKFI